MTIDNDPTIRPATEKEIKEALFKEDIASQNRRFVTENKNLVPKEWLTKREYYFGKVMERLLVNVEIQTAQFDKEELCKEGSAWVDAMIVELNRVELAEKSPEYKPQACK